MEFTAPQDLPHLSTTAAIDHRDESGLAAQFLRSAAYSGAEAPVRALAQAADHFTGGHADAAVQSGFQKVGVEQPKPAEFGTSGWVAQQVGGAVGMMVPFLALRSGIKHAATGAFGEQLFAGSVEAGTRSLGQVALREAALSGATGMVYGTLLKPSKESDVGTSSFISERLKSGLADGATFAALGAASPYISRGFESAADVIEKSALPSMAKAPLSAALRFPAVTGVLSGIPSGFVGAEANALKDGRLATAQEIKESMASMSVVGGAMGTAQWMLEKVAKPTRDDSADRSRENAEAKDKAEAREKMTPAERDAELRQLVEQAQKRMFDEQARRMGNRDASGIPDNDILEMMDRNSVKTQGLAARNVAAERAEGKFMPRGVETKDAGTPTDPVGPGMDIVLGASGAETTAHVGFLKAIEDNQVPVGRITGVSGGSLVATLYANHFSPDQIKDILMSDEFRHPTVSQLARMYHVYDPWNLFPYMMDFKPWLQDFVDKYNLKPQDNLRIVAADAKTHAPIVFEGTNYDLTTALTASTDATPALGLKPIQIDGRNAVDGFYYHPTPAQLCAHPAIASNIGFVKEMPHEFLAPWDYYLHFKELAYYEDLKGRYPDPPGGHIMVTTGFPDVAMSTFSISKQTVERLIDHGYAATMDRLKQPDAQKLIHDAQAAARK